MATLARIRSLHVYPVKSCAGIALDSAHIDARGLEADRRWMAVDPAGRFLTQRTHPQLARVQVHRAAEHLRLSYPGLPDLLLIGDTPGPRRRVRIWSDEVDAVIAPGAANDWISSVLGAGCALVRADARTERAPERRWTGDAAAPVAFPDGFPVLVCSTASLESLGGWMGTTPQMACFRPNVVIEGLPAWAEDGIRELRCADVTLRLVKPCTRCILTSRDPLTGEPGPDPLPALRTHRWDAALKGSTFGQNAVVIARPGARLYAGAGLLVA